MSGPTYLDLPGLGVFETMVDFDQAMASLYEPGHFSKDKSKMLLQVLAHAVRTIGVATNIKTDQMRVLFTYESARRAIQDIPGLDSREFLESLESGLPCSLYSIPVKLWQDGQSGLPIGDITIAVTQDYDNQTFYPALVIHNAFDAADEADEPILVQSNPLSSS